MFILTARPEFYIDALPLSWYAGVPLLGLPFILVYLMYRDGVRKTLAGNLYMLQKVASLTGFVVYMVKYHAYALYNASLDEFYSLKLLVLIVIFFGIDVILCAVILLMNRKTKLKSEGEICK